MATLLSSWSHHFDMSVLHPAKELDGRGTVFGFDLLGVSDDDLPDAPQLGDRIGVVVDAQVVVHPRRPAHPGRAAPAPDARARCSRAPGWRSPRAPRPTARGCRRWAAPWRWRRRTHPSPGHAP